MVAAVLALAGVVVTAHGVMGGDHMMSDGAAMCLAVASTAVLAVGAVIAIGALTGFPLWRIVAPVMPEPLLLVADTGVRARAGPPGLQVFRL